jgi:2-polyprenyl-6-methoxyphenol hydroxylase-like FAD-dependent oxidoreductase
VTPTALIVGAGIGGLSAGIALRRAGWNVRIFERATSPRELGFGLGLAPNAMAALAQLGLADVVAQRGFSPSAARAEIRRTDGAILKRADVPSTAALGGRFVIALRPAIHGVLLDAVGADAVTVSSEATDVTQTSAGGHTASGGREHRRGQLLIGADGIGSVIRRVLHPAERPPRDSGLVAVRGAVHEAHPHLGGLAAVYYVGPGIESAIVRASETGIYWFVSANRALVPADLREPAAVLAHLSRGFDPTFRAITGMTEDLRFDELVDRDPLPFWTRGRVTLLGDAAHPLLPHTGQGAAQAIVDAVTLGARLGSREAMTDPREALDAYERERRPKTATLLAQGRRTARMMRTTNPLVVRLREMAIRAIPVKSIVRVLMTINRRAGTDVRG